METMNKLNFIMILLLFTALSGFTNPYTGINRANENLADSVWFTWENTCHQDATSFTAHYTATISPVAWDWDFGSSGSSHFSNPQFRFDATGNYLVTLNVTDVNGQQHSCSKTVSIFENPDPIIFGDRNIFCNKEQNILFYTNYTEGSNYEWKVNHGDILSKSNNLFLNIDFEIVPPEQLTLSLSETNSHGCSCEKETEILVTHYEAPPTGIVAQKVQSADNKLLLCLMEEPEKYNYNWGYSSYTADSVLVTEFSSGFITDNFYNYSGSIDTALYVYWVEILDPSENRCSSKSFLKDININEKNQSAIK